MARREEKRNMNENFKLFRKPAVWGYKLFYERKEWNKDPQWVYNKDRTAYR